MFKLFKKWFNKSSEIRELDYNKQSISAKTLDELVIGFLSHQISISAMKPYKTVSKFIESYDDKITYVCDSWVNPVNYDTSEALKNFSKKYKLLKLKSGNPEFDEFIKSLN